MRWPLAAVALLAAAAGAAAVVCRDVDVRNDVTNLARLRDCTEVVGNLFVVLMERTTGEHDFDDYVFPNLTKISGMLLFNKVDHLTSIGRMFPNLSLIRGISTIMDYSLVVYDMPDLREIALPKLRYISRGWVRVEKCPKICYVDTVNWRLLGPSTDITYNNVNNGTCASCPENCHGHCWNDRECQDLKEPECHKECLGCTEPNNPRKCYACKNFENYGLCVAECPENRYEHRDTGRCVTAEECVGFSKPSKEWWVFNGTCRNDCPPGYAPKNASGTFACEHCGDDCVIWCKNLERDGEAYNVGVIDHEGALKIYKRCTHVAGHVTINFSNLRAVREKLIVGQLRDYLGQIRYISNKLVIGRTNYIREIDFLPHLREIGGEGESGRAIFFFENTNLQKLWDWRNFSLTIRKGSISFHDNPQLCLSEIERLANVTRVNYTENDVSRYSNGHKSACNVANLKVEITNTNETNVTLTWTLPTDAANINDTYVGFTVYYTESGAGNVTRFASDDVCDDKGWNSNFTTNTTIMLLGLNPYTRYAYYIRSYKSMGGSQTPVDYFQTLAADPDGPGAVRVKALSHDSIELQWERPRKTNGKLANYKLFVVREKDNERFVRQRDYCRHPMTPSGAVVDFADEEDDLGTPATTVANTTSYNISDSYLEPDQNCSCPAPAVKEFRFFLKDNYVDFCEDDSLSKFGMDRCRGYMYNVSFKDSSEFLKVHKRNFREMIKRNESVNHKEAGFIEINDIDANATSYVVKPLDSFSLYIFYFSVCNEPRKDKKELCSYIVERYARTLKHPDADDVSKPEVTIEKNSVVVSWLAPKKPNSMIVSYRIQYTKLDKEHVAPPSIECQVEDNNSRKKREVLTSLAPGEYKLNVQAISLAGPGKLSPPEFFTIDPPVPKVALIVTMVISFVTIFVAALTSYFWYKRKKRLDNLHLITSVNPDYAPTYIEDEWEVERHEIELHHEIGQGIFGAVFYGIIKPKNLPVAVKTCREHASLRDQMDFLNEASLMKSFNNAHHVVKLVGVVSKGSPPLVIMELMERGDLKKYLRKMRDSSQNITCNEIYRMAIEIADGMAYLSARKFVHRDLAARNCMVGQDRTVKIGDFGMTRDVYETDYYKKGTKGLLPVRWMAPESLADGVFTTDSDVWSYGIILWEIATLAEQPYQGLANEQVLQFVTSKGRLERPAECPDLLYEIMRTCWHWRPIDRPTFNGIVEKLEDHVGRDFQLVSFYHSREGRESRLLARERTVNQPALSAEGMRDYYSAYNASDDEVSLHVEGSFLGSSG